MSRWMAFFIGIADAVSIQSQSSHSIILVSSAHILHIAFKISIC